MTVHNDNNSYANGTLFFGKKIYDTIKYKIFITIFIISLLLLNIVKTKIKACRIIMC